MVSQENIDLVRAFLTRWERGDFDTEEAFDPQVEFTRTGGGSEVLGYGTEARGIEGLRAAMTAWTDEWRDVSVEAERYAQVGGRVFVLMRHRAVGTHRGASLEQQDAPRRGASDHRRDEGRNVEKECQADARA